jgi:hypothetical protein
MKVEIILKKGIIPLLLFVKIEVVIETEHFYQRGVNIWLG